MPLLSRFVALVTLTLVALTAPTVAQQQPAPASPPPDASPFNVVIHVDFVPRRAAEGMTALQQPNHFIIVEVWRNRAAYDVRLARLTAGG